MGGQKMSVGTSDIPSNGQEADKSVAVCVLVHIRTLPHQQELPPEEA